MACEFKTIRRVEFSETDMAGIVHYSNFFRYMEFAEHAFYRSLGFSVVTDQFETPLGWPRVHAECDYIRPVRFENEIEVHLLLAEKRTRSLKYLFRFRNLSVSPVEECARGNLVVVCITRDANGNMKSVPIPEVISSQLEVAPALG